MPGGDTLPNDVNCQAQLTARGVPTVYYGDEQGFTGDGNDQDAREDMFPSKTAVYNDNDLIGTDKTKFGFEKTPLLGLDLAGLHKEYGDVLEVLTKEQAEKKREEMKKMFGDQIDQLGEAQASTDIHLLPTENESYHTTVWPTFNKETGLIESVRFTVPFEGEEGGAERLMAAMKKAWGEPKEEEKYGSKRWVFSEEPFITVEDSIGKSWEIEKQAKRD